MVICDYRYPYKVGAEEKCSREALSEAAIAGLESNQKSKSNCENIKAKNFCCFHNRDYALKNVDKVMEVFCEHLKNTMYDRNEPTQFPPTNPVMCIGFHIPGEVNFDGKKFTNPIYFTKAEFHKKVTFKDSTFEGSANFDYAKFYYRAIFSNTIFNSEANFSNCSSLKDVYFTVLLNLISQIRSLNAIQNLTMV